MAASTSAPAETQRVVDPRIAFLQERPAKAPEQLTDPAHIGASGSASQRFNVSRAGAIRRLLCITSVCEREKTREWQASVRAA
jgi:hypothetical protein